MTRHLFIRHSIQNLSGTMVSGVSGICCPTNQIAVEVRMIGTRAEGMHAGVGRIEAQLTTIIKQTQPRIDSSSFSSFIPKFLTPPPPTDIFTGREDILQQMAVSFGFSTASTASGKQRRFVLHGLGGVGKTQTALKFLDLHRDKYVSSIDMRQIF